MDSAVALSYVRPCLREERPAFAEGDVSGAFK